MRGLHLALAAPILIAVAPAAAAQQVNPLSFFEGRTESNCTVKVMFKKPYRGFSLGRGRIEPDGSLTLVQRVHDDGEAPHDRHWRVRQISPGRYVGTMSDASGPVTIEQVGDRYRFRFRMKGKLNVEQWLTPLPGGASAISSSKVRRLGLVVATIEGMIRKR
jgi:hypothetical protein